MRTLKVLKYENLVMELSITNALIYILKNNDVSFKLENQKGAFLIHVDDDLDFKEDLTFPEISLERLVDSSNSSLNKTENERFFNNFVEPLFGQDNDNLALTFKYFETLDEDYLMQGEKFTYKNDTGKDVSISLTSKANVKMIGTRTYSRGIRKLNSSSATQVDDICVKVVLSVLGFLLSSNYLRIGDDLEFNMFYKPKVTDDLIVPKFKTYVDKQTGEEKHLKMIKGVPKNIGLAEIYLRSIQKLNKNSMKKDYSGIYVSTLKPSGNKPMADKFFELPLLNVSNEFLEKFIQLLTWNKVNLDVRFAVADYFLNQDFNSFIKLIQVLGKDKDTLIVDSILKELIDLQIDKVKRIYGLDSIKHMGIGLKKLIENGNGYSIQVDLLNCTDINSLIKIIQELTLIYSRSYDYKLSINMDELLSEIETTQDVKIIASAIITYSSIFIKKKSNEEETEKTEEINLKGAM